MRRAAACAAAVLMMLTAGGCGAPKYHYEVRRDLSVWFTNADSVIQSVREGLKSRSPRITVTYSSESGNMDDIPAVISEIMMYAMSETDDPCEGDYLYHQYGGYELEYACETQGGSRRYTVEILPCYYTDPSQEEAVTQKVGGILEGILSDGMTDEEKVRAIYGYVYENVSYDRVHKKNEHYHLKSTAYAALMNGCAVCQGYSVLMYRLLREAGLDARVITGMADGEYHAWNIVRLAEGYYNIDVTWDVLTGTHDNFLKGEESFSLRHIRDEKYAAESFCKKYPMSDTDKSY